MSQPRTTISQDMQTWFSVQLAFAKFLSKIKGNFWGSAVSMILALYYKFPFILDRNYAKANSTENHVCTSCDIVVLGRNLFNECFKKDNEALFSRISWEWATKDNSRLVLIEAPISSIILLSENALCSPWIASIRCID